MRRSKVNLLDIKIFTCPRRVEGQGSYSALMFDLIQKNEYLKFDGILFFENHSNDVDPWVFGQALLTKSKFQSPFIAVNPAYAGQKKADFDRRSHHDQKSLKI